MSCAWKCCLSRFASKSFQKMQCQEHIVDDLTRLGQRPGERNLTMFRKKMVLNLPHQKYLRSCLPNRSCLFWSQAFQTEDVGFSQPAVSYFWHFATRRFLILVSSIPHPRFFDFNEMSHHCPPLLSFPYVFGIGMKLHHLRIPGNLQATGTIVNPSH